MNDNGEMIAGILASVYLWDCMCIDLFWIDEKYRMHGIGTQMLILIFILVVSLFEYPYCERCMCNLIFLFSFMTFITFNQESKLGSINSKLSIGNLAPLFFKNSYVS